MDGVGLGDLKVHPIECAFFVALGMHHRKFRRVEEAAAVQPVDRDEVSPLLAAVTKVKPCIGRAKTTVGSSYGAMGRGKALTGTRRNVNHKACFLAEFGRRSSCDYFHRLNRIEWNLV